jgi:multiple sugar transport system substrate-binding protein
MVVTIVATSKPDVSTTASTKGNTSTPTLLVDDPTPIPTSTVLVDTSQLDGLELVFWHPFMGARQKALAKMVEIFNQQNEWGIRIQPKAWNGWGDLDEQARLIPVSKEKPDLLLGYNDQVLRWDAGGYLFLDLDNYIEDSRWGLSPEERQAFYPAIWAQDYVPDGLIQGKLDPGGRRLGLPWYRSSLFFVYNTSWADELGFTSAPKKPEDLLLQACAAADANRKDTERNNDGTGGWLITPEPSLLSAWIFAYGGEIARPDRKGYQFDTPEARQALESIYEFYDSGCAWTSLDADPHDAFASRRTLFFVDSQAEESDIEDALDRAGNEDEWQLLPFLSPDGEPVIDVTGPGLIISQSTPARQLASWLFARWLVSAQNQAEWAGVTGFLPVSTTAVELLKKAQTSPALRQALPFLPYSHPEPVYASWYTLHWGLTEALSQLLVPDLSSEKINGILKNLDRLATEVHSQER